MDDYDSLVAEPDYPELGSREWFIQLWTRAFCAADRCNWTFTQALRIAEGQHLVVFPRDLPLMPRVEYDWCRKVKMVGDERLIMRPADPLAGCEMFNVPAEPCPPGGTYLDPSVVPF